jgi:DHA1 family tetracycline resistance protein-like MFS transporter
MGLIGAAFGIGLVLGPVLGGLLSGSRRHPSPCPACWRRCLSALAVPAIWWFLPEPHRERRSRTRSQPRRPLWDMIRASHSRLLLLQYALHTGSVSAITYLFPLWVYALLDWEAREVGIVFGVVGVIMAVNQGLLMGRLIRRLGERRPAAYLHQRVPRRPAAAQFAAGPLSMVVATLLLSMGGATLCMPVLNAMTSRRAVAEERGRLLGAASSAAAVGRIAGPAAGRGAAQRGGFPPPGCCHCCWWSPTGAGRSCILAAPATPCTAPIEVVESGAPHHEMKDAR